LGDIFERNEEGVLVVRREKKKNDPTQGKPSSFFFIDKAPEGETRMPNLDQIEFLLK